MAGKSGAGQPALGENPPPGGGCDDSIRRDAASARCGKRGCAVDHASACRRPERSKYAREAARYKRGAPDVEAPQRVEQVVAKAKALAAQDGLPPEVAEATYRAMIKAFTEYERGVAASAH